VPDGGALVENFERNEPGICLFQST
jgi:hypothetical protein